MKRKSLRPEDPDVARLTPADLRQIGFGEAQVRAGLTYGPFGRTERVSIEDLFAHHRSSRRVVLEIPTVLFTYLENGANRFGMTARDLMRAVLESHRFNDRNRQNILLAIEAARGKKKTPRKSTR